MRIYRKAILVIHGFSGSLSDNEYLVNYLQFDSKLDVYTVTLKGHDKEILSGVKYTDWIKSAEDYLNFLLSRYHTVYLVGHSMGGVISTYLASKYKRVTKLALVAPAFEYVSIDQNKKDLKNLKNIINDDGNLTAYQVILSKIFRVSMPTLKEFTILIKNYKKYTEEITIPTLILHGELDEVIPILSSQYAYDTINSKEKKFVKLPNGRHAIFKGDERKNASEIIRKFLRGGIQWETFKK